MSILDKGLVRRTRQNHAIEHATISILMRRNPDLQLVGGRSDHRGFYIYGKVDSEALRKAVTEALSRLQSGEARLAIHPNCGTNLVTAGTLAGLAVFTTTAIGRQRQTGLLDQLPAAVLAATGALLLGRPLGAWLQQRVTTLADVRDLRLGPIRLGSIGRWTHHFVVIEKQR